jgi:hypothetical protein
LDTLDPRETYTYNPQPDFGGSNFFGGCRLQDVDGEEGYGAEWRHGNLREP